MSSVRLSTETPAFFTVDVPLPGQAKLRTPSSSAADALQPRFSNHSTCIKLHTSPSAAPGRCARRSCLKLIRQRAVCTEPTFAGQKQLESHVITFSSLSRKLCLSYPCAPARQRDLRSCAKTIQAALRPLAQKAHRNKRLDSIVGLKSGLKWARQMCVHQRIAVMSSYLPPFQMMRHSLQGGLVVQPARLTASTL